MMANPVDDQLQAASNEAEEVFANVAGTGSMRVSGPGSVTARIAAEFIHALNGPGGRMCQDVAYSPQVIHGAACMPGIAGCVPCMAQLLHAQLMLDQADGMGRTCDGCKRKSACGYVGVIQNGPLLLTVSLCPACTKRDDEV